MGLIRLILAISVALEHLGGIYGLKLGYGKAEVHAFFVISGFYMFYVLHEKYYEVGVTQFYKARYARLLPSYLVVAVLTLVAMAMTGAAHDFGIPFDQWVGHIASAEPWFSSYILFSNATILFLDATALLQFDGRFASWATDFAQSPVIVYKLLLVPQGWSLGSELLFYLIAPFILLNPKRIALAAAASVAVLALVVLLGVPEDPWAYRFFPAIVWLFLLGALSCWAWRRWSERRWVHSLGIAAAGFIAAWILTWSFNPMQDLIKKAILIGVVATLVGPIFAATRDNRLDARLGELSYPIYISHLLALLVAGHVVSGEMVSEVALLLTLVLSLALVHFVERPVDRWRSRFARRGTAAPALVDSVGTAPGAALSLTGVPLAR